MAGVASVDASSTTITTAAGCFATTSRPSSSIKAGMVTASSWTGTTTASDSAVSVPCCIGGRPRLLQVEVDATRRDAGPSDPMTDAVLFWLLAEVIGLLALTAARALFGRLQGGGLAFSRPLGLLLASVHLVGYGRATVFVGLGLLAAVLLGWSLPRLQPLLQAGALRAALRTTPVRLWVAGELIFTIGFFGWALVRSYSPDVWQTEKPMDMAFVNS